MFLFLFFILISEFAIQGFQWAGFPIQSSTWVSCDMLTSHTISLDSCWKQMWITPDAVKRKATKQNKLEPEFDCEHWSWMDNGGHIVYPAAPSNSRHPLNITLLGPA
jgi:hypothetical protein